MALSKTPLPKIAAGKNLRFALYRLIQCSILLIMGLNSYAQPASPKFQTFQPLSPRFSQQMQPPIHNQGNSVIQNDPLAEQNLKLMQQGGMTVPGPTTARQNKITEAQQFIREDEAIEKADRRISLPKLFQNNFQQFLQLNPDNFSIIQAVYLSESAYYDNATLPPYSQFETAIGKRAELARQILNKEGLSEKDDIAVNYAIQKLYSQENQYYDSTSRNNYLVKRLGYDFDDYMGDKDWTKMFVTKLLHTGTGQCRSMPLVYLCIAEKLHAKAYLSMAPNHSFIQFFDKDGKRYNFEATNGNLVTQVWLMQSTYINATALKNKTYLDTLSSRKLYAQCLGDFLLSYLVKTRHYDDFSEQITKKILEIDPTNITALMEQANRSYTIFQNMLRTTGNPPQDKYSNYPELYSAYQNLQDTKQKVKQTGFQEMPQDAYQRWLQSLEMEKQKEQNKMEQDRMQQEIKKLKKMNSSLINNKKD